MRSLSAIFGFTALLSTLITPIIAAPSFKRVGNAITSTIFQLDSNGTWFENIAVRSNDNIPATRIDAPEQWSINLSDGQNTGSRLYTFPNATSALGVTEIRQDVYAAVTGKLTIPTKCKGAGQFLDGLVRFSEDLCLIADAVKGVIWRLELKTTEYSEALSDSYMLPAQDQPVGVGVNGVRVWKNYVYFTSTAQEIFARIPTHENGSATGSVEVIGSGFTPDTFYLADDGTAYIVTNPHNEHLKVSPEGRVQLVTGNEFKLTLGGCTGVTKSLDASVLYVKTSGAQISPILCEKSEPAKIVAVYL